MTKAMLAWFVAEMAAGLAVGATASCLGGGRIGLVLGYLAAVVMFKLCVERLQFPRLRVPNRHGRPAARAQTWPPYREPNVGGAACV